MALYVKIDGVFRDVTTLWHANSGLTVADVGIKLGGVDLAQIFDYTGGNPLKMSQTPTGILIKNAVTENAYRDLNQIFTTSTYIECVEPTVVQDPQGVSAYVGSQVYLQCKGHSNVGDLTFQWQRRNQDGTYSYFEPTAHPGSVDVSTDRLTFTSANIGNSGVYRCIVRNPCGGVASAPASVSITNQPIDSVRVSPLTQTRTMPPPGELGGFTIDVLYSAVSSSQLFVQLISETQSSYFAVFGTTVSGQDQVFTVFNANPGVGQWTVHAWIARNGTLAADGWSTINGYVMNSSGGGSET